MNIFFEEHRFLLQHLLAAKVEFMLIGGYAVNYYGYNRSTGDMDIWLKPDNVNRDLLIRALQEMHFDDHSLNVLAGWDFVKPQIFHFGDIDRPDKTEFMTHISGISYSAADRLKLFANIDGLELPVIHVQSLIQNKKATGRLKDAADAEVLEKILIIRKKDHPGK